MVGIQGMILLWTLTACNQHCSWPLSRMINILCFVSSKKIGIRVLHSSPFHGQTITILMASNKRFPNSHGISITTGFPMVFPWVVSSGFPSPQARFQGSQWRSERAQVVSLKDGMLGIELMGLGTWWEATNTWDMGYIYIWDMNGKY